MPLTDNIVDLPEYKNLYSKIIGNSGPGVVWDQGNTSGVLNQLGNKFSTLFKNYIGRDPTTEEVQKMYGEFGNQVLNSGSGFSGVRSDDAGTSNLLKQYIGDSFQQAAQDTAVSKADAQKTQYNSLADQYLEMGKRSLGNLSDDLKSYSTSLFEKLRPQLNLAAQAGGYADSGGQTLQEQGALKDLANEGQGTLAQAKYDVENQANNIRLGGAAAPVSMSAQFNANTPYTLSSVGQGATSFNNTNAMSNYDYLRNLGLIDFSGRVNERTTENNAPSFGRSLSQSFATNFGSGAGKFFDPTTWYKAK